MSDQPQEPSAPSPEVEAEEVSYPTPFQRKVGWMALAAISIVVIAAVGIGSILVLNSTLRFLQPILVPLAVAGIIAYLLEPVILWLRRRGWKHKPAVMTVYIAFNIFAAFLLIFVISRAVDQAIQFSQPDQLEQFSEKIGEFSTTQLDRIELEFPGFAGTRTWLTDGRGVAWVKEHLQPDADEVVGRITGSFETVFSFLGYVFGLVLVPVYLYYFLTNSTSIAQKWADYLPLWESDFKAEVVDVLSEINGYIIAYFRGQMVVSMIDGALIAGALYFLGLPYWLLIGVFLAILGLIPYLGNLLVLIPAVLIAIAHFSGEPNAWIYPLAVIAIFLVLQQINGLFTAPRIVGDSVGLHPLTVIFSMLFWALLLGGILGALLAVPMTASLKVLFQRYVWKTRIKPGVQARFNIKERAPKRKRSRRQ